MWIGSKAVKGKCNFAVAGSQFQDSQKILKDVKDGVINVAAKQAFA